MEGKLTEGGPAAQATLAIEVELGTGRDVEIPEARRFFHEAHHLLVTAAFTARLQVLDDDRKSLVPVTASRAAVLIRDMGSHVL